MHTDDPLTWDYVARRELEIQSQPGGEPPVTKQAKAEEVGRREERCCAVYEEAVKTLPTGKVHQTLVWGRNDSVRECETEAPIAMTETDFRNLSGSLQRLAFQLALLSWWRMDVLWPSFAVVDKCVPLREMILYFAMYNVHLLPKFLREK